MRQGLTPSQAALAREAAVRHGAGAKLLAALDRNELTPDERRELGYLVTEDLAFRGFDADYNPTPLGRDLEDLIDVLNAVD